MNINIEVGNLIVNKVLLNSGAVTHYIRAIDKNGFDKTFIPPDEVGNKLIDMEQTRRHQLGEPHNNDDMLQSLQKVIELYSGDAKNWKKLEALVSAGAYVSEAISRMIEEIKEP
jgi:hypothetical protein